MRHSTFGWAATALLAGLGVAGATTRFVNVSNTAPANPYNTWASAATSIQAAADVAVAGDLILVTNGTYSVGGRVVYGAMSNRVALTKVLTVQSVNGPAVTAIQGAWDPAATNGDAAVRCAYLAAGARLSGFTLTNGATRGATGDSTKEQAGGGVWCAAATAIISNCVIAGNVAYDHGAGAAGGTLVACILTNNTAAATVFASGGGASGAVLSNSIVVNNSSLYGGGVASCTLNACTLAWNVASNWGGAASFCSLTSCTLNGNMAVFGGGGGGYSSGFTNCVLADNWVLGGNGGGAAYAGTLLNCLLSGNYAYGCNGGGAMSADLQNCALIGNQANYGGGSYGCTLNNCSLSGNWVGFEGGGDWAGQLTNCIIYFNSAFMLSGSNWSGSTMRYCCTTPLPAGGAGNFTNAPGFANSGGGDLHLLPGSPCIDAGLNAAAPGTVDLDGSPRIVGGTVDLGAYEWQGRPLFVSLQPPGPGGLPLALLGQTQRVVEIQASSNCAQWFWLATRTNTTGQILYTDTAATNQPRRYYKAIQLP